MVRSGWLALLFISCLGCNSESGTAELVWGDRGVSDGAIVKPRAVAMDDADHLYLVDWTARIQGYDRDGKFLGHVWQTPDYANGRPSGLSIDRDGNILVSDSHYGCLRIYDKQGKLLRTIDGKSGSQPAQFGYISDAVQDQAGNFYVAEFGEHDRITKLSADGKFLCTWGSAGSAPGEFARIRALALNGGKLYVADSCNHRIQVFSLEGQYLRSWGTPGKAPGELKYPYDLAFSKKNPEHLYVVERENHRVQKFNTEGKSLGMWGSPGRGPGQLFSPWALCVDSRGAVHVVDTENHRVQRVRF